MSAVECAGEANELAVQANKQTDGRVAQYFSLDSWLFWPTVHCWVGNSFRNGVTRGEMIEQNASVVLKTANVTFLDIPFEVCLVSCEDPEYHDVIFSLLATINVPDDSNDCAVYTAE